MYGKYAIDNLELIKKNDVKAPPNNIMCIMLYLSFWVQTFWEIKTKKSITTKPFVDFFLKKSLKRPYRYAKIRNYNGNFKKSIAI